MSPPPSWTLRDIPALTEIVVDVGCQGSIHPTIQAAIDAAPSRATVLVCDGTYLERLTVAGKRLVLRSAHGAAATTIDAEGLGRALSVVDGAHVVVEGFTFANGATDGVGGNVHCASSTLQLTRSMLRAGVAGNGGGVGSSECSGSVELSSFDGNAAWSGGGAWSRGDDFAIRANVFFGNRAIYAGGGLRVSGDALVVGNTIQSNVSDVLGGGVFLDASWGDFSSNNVVDNTSGNDGGGTYVLDGAPLLSGNTFDGNVAGDEGGGLRLKESTATVVDNTFRENHATYFGGGAKASHAAVTMTGNAFVENSASLGGGALALEESGAGVSGGVFEANVAPDGGALYVESGWDPVTVEDVVFVENAAEGRGGALFVALPGPKTTLRRVELSGGAASWGGAVYAIGSDVDVENCVLRGNGAGVAGGALYYDSSSGAITNVVLEDNESLGGAGLVVGDGVDGLVVRNSIFHGNDLGAAVVVDSGAPPAVGYSDFFANAGDFAGMDVPPVADGNLADDPAFRDAGAGDFSLLPTSSLVDVGDPAILDQDGSRSDMGRFGGPNAN